MTAPRGTAKLILVSGFAAALLSGCAGAISCSVLLTDQAIMPIANGSATHVAPSDLAQAMLRAGFTRDEILQYGPGIGEALATSGAAQVRRGKVVAALFAVNDGQLIVTSLDRFVQPLTAGGPAG